jgi:hypothetical protein
LTKNDGADALALLSEAEAGVGAGAFIPGPEAEAIVKGIPEFRGGAARAGVIVLETRPGPAGVGRLSGADSVLDGTPKFGGGGASKMVIGREGAASGRLGGAYSISVSTSGGAATR